MGETQKWPLQLSFNSSLRVEFQGARVTSDGGLILVRELDERLGLSELMDRHSTDARGKAVRMTRRLFGGMLSSAAVVGTVWAKVWRQWAGRQPCQSGPP